MTGDYFVFKFHWRCVDRKHLMHFQGEKNAHDGVVWTGFIKSLALLNTDIVLYRRWEANSVFTIPVFVSFRSSQNLHRNNYLDKSPKLPNFKESKFVFRRFLKTHKYCWLVGFIKKIEGTYRLLHGWWARTIFIHELWKIANERASLRASEFAILHNKWIKIV